MGRRHPGGPHQAPEREAPITSRGGGGLIRGVGINSLRENGKIGYREEQGSGREGREEER